MAHMILRLPAVKRRTALSLFAAGNFPRPIRLGPRCVGWIEAEVDDWLERRIAQSRNSVA